MLFERTALSHKPEELIEHEIKLAPGACSISFSFGIIYRMLRLIFLSPHHNIGGPDCRVAIRGVFVVNEVQPGLVEGLGRADIVL